MKNYSICKDYIKIIMPLSQGVVDDKTSSDLELDRIFRHIDCTKTSPGKSVLYSWLRIQCLSVKDINTRVAMINAWTNTDKRNLVKGLLEKCGHQDIGSVVSEIWNPAESLSYRGKYFLFFWFILTIIAYLAPFLLGKAFLIYSVLPVAVINFVVHFKWRSRIAPHYGSICYLARLLRYSRRLIGNLPDGLSRENELLTHVQSKTRKIGKNTLIFLNPSRVSLDLMNSMIEYLRVFLLAEVVSFVVLYEQINNYKPELKAIFKTIGEIDASLAVSEFAVGNSELCIPSFNQCIGNLHFQNMNHPLLKNCIGNSAHFNKGVILTGSNMAGKSTFLRTVGVNQILSTTLGFAFADEFETCFFRVASSIQILDSLSDNQSHYYAEAKRFFDLWTLMNGETPWLILVDEILSGTNSTDRNAAVVSILSEPAQTESLIIVSTHELDIARSLRSSYENYHFSESFQGNRVVFDYLLKKGIVEQSNALRILRKVGFTAEQVPGVDYRVTDCPEKEVNTHKQLGKQTPAIL